MFKKIKNLIIIGILISLPVYAYNLGHGKSQVFGDFPGGTYTEIEPDGGIVYVGEASGVAFGEISVMGNSSETSIGGTGVGNKVQITDFDTNGIENNMDADHTTDDITVTKEGKYLITISMTINSVAGSLAQFHFSMWKNNGATELANIHSHRDLPAGAGGNAGVVSLSGIVDVAVDDTLELWVYNATNTQNLVINAVTMTATMVGGT
jgi:hypothetical protein